MVAGAPHSPAAIEAWIIARLAAEFAVDPAALDPTAPFEHLGLASREVIMLSGDLEEWLGLTLSPVLLYEYPSIRALAGHLASLKQPPAMLEHEQPASAAPASASARMPIAIIGLAARFPGAEDLDAFWQALVAGQDCIRAVPAGRWDPAQVAAQLAGKKPLGPWGGFLDRVDEFDAAFFGISGREAAHIDPQQRLLLEATWEALADAGLPVDKLAGRPVGAYVGISGSEYGQAQLGRLDQINGYVGTGSALSIAANRLSYFFDWRGPSLAVDTACSSSLVALHLACGGLRSGETQLAVVAGVNLILTPAVTVNFNEAGAMAADGRCKAFDARADGYVRSEGVGVAVLKPLAQAQADGDRIYAVILGSAVNQDGRTNGLMAPNPRSQEEVLRAAYQDAGVAPSALSYVEAHGTGTLLGDPIEAKALAAVRQSDPDAASAPPLRLGSVKTNVGHLEAAAGIAGLIKVALALHHRQLPPSLHFQTPNPHIPFDTLPLRVQTQLEPWPAPGERALAGVSSFGFGGTNAHAVLAALSEVAPAAPSPAPAASASHQLLLLSARTPEALRETARRWQALLSAPVDFDALAYTAARRQTHLEQRLAVTASSPADAHAALGAFLSGEADPRLEAGAAPAAAAGQGVVFVCPGQGGQWAGMARELYATQPAFRRSLDATAAAFHPFVDWDLRAQLLAETPSADIDVVQPVLFALAVAFAALWQALGVRPAAVIGHSLGEVAAAHIAGALTLEDAACVICRRSRLLRQISGQGLMAAVELTAEEAQAALAGREAHVAVAAVNGPRSVVLSGAPAAVEALLAELEARGVYCRRIQVDVASHSPQVDALRAPLLDALAEVRPMPARLPFYSTVTGEALAGPELDAAYWADNLRRPVLFGPVAARLHADGMGAFVELGPHPVLLPALGQLPPLEGRRPPVLVASQRRAAPQWPAFLAGLGRLHAHGLAVDWTGLFPQPRPLVPLPAYPWQRERYWFAPAAPTAGQLLAQPGGHPLLGGHLALATVGGPQVWQNPLSLAALPFLGDHRVQAQVLFPAAAYLEMALAAGARLAGEQPFQVEQVRFQESLPLRPAAPVLTQLVLTPAVPVQAAFQIAAQADGRAEWAQHAQGFVRLAPAAPPAPESLGALQARLSARQPAADFYASLTAIGLHYGPAFQRVSEVWAGPGESLARLTVPDDADRYRLHPALLDGAFQALAAAFPSGAASAGRLFLPVALDVLRVFDALIPGAAVWCRARLDGDPASGAVRGGVTLFDESGRVLAVAEGLHLRAVGEAPLAPEAQSLSRWFYRVAWEDAPLTPPAAPRAGTWLLFVQTDTWQAALASQFAEAGQRVVHVTPGAAFAQRDAAHFDAAPASPESFRQLLTALEAAGQSVTGMIYGWGLSNNTADPAAKAEQAAVGVLHLAQALAAAGARSAPRLYLLSGGLASAPLAGLAGTLNHEYPDLRATTLRLEGAPDLPAIVAECLADTPETQVSLASGRRAVARLLPFTPAAALAGPPAPAVASGQPVRLRARRPGLLNSLALEPAEPPTPALGEVVIQVEAAGLNFLDLLAALGTRPDQPAAAPDLGLECAGRVTAVGSGVSGLAVGDEVVALAPGAFATFAVTRAELAAHKPPSLSWESAATLPIAFLTAHYALHYVARLQRGERVLIHSAASGAGLAAVQVAQWLGAEVLATAGSEARREQLRARGVQHVFDSRSLAFAEGVQSATNGQGVDVVLNSLSGDAIPASLALLRSRGRFVELGKRDIYAQRTVALYALRHNLSLAVVDLATLAAESPAFVGGLLGEVVALVEQGAFHPLPHEAFALADAASAFRRMAQAQHRGKLVLTPALRAAAPAPRRSPGQPLAIRPDGAYLVTGGLGAIGRRVAAYLVEQGARHLVLVGRSAPSAAALADLAVLEAAGAALHLIQADVASLADMQALSTRFGHEAGANGASPLPPLRGVFHAAGVLDDGVLVQQCAARFAGVLAPKVAGSWHLHQLSLGQPVEAFVMFSSAAALVGAPGQGNYAAANAFMDELARVRQAQGLPALSIQWGPWAEIGLAARPDRASRLSNRGFDAIQPDAGMRALHWALAETDPVLAVLPFDVRQWRQSFPQAAGLPLLAALAGESAAAPASGHLRAALLAAGSPREQRALLETHLRREIAEVLRIPASRIGPATALDSLGFDSLLALELRNRLELGLAARLSATLVWNYPTMPALAGYLASVVLDSSPEPAVSAPAAAPESAAPEAEAALLAEVVQLSDDDALRELLGGEGQA